MNMPEPFPAALKIEVKTARDTRHQLSERDLNGIRPDGYAAILLTERLHHGPRWVLVPVALLTAGCHTDADIASLARDVLPELTAAINRFWSNWILDENLRDRLFAQIPMKLREALDWCLTNHVPRENRSTGNMREGRLASALADFRTSLDRFVGVNGPQQEGFVHQSLLAQALISLGYRLNENPVGVPDISAIWTGRV